MDRLRHARLKVVRAQEHLDALKIDINAYLDSKPYQVSVENQGGKKYKVQHAVVTAPPPERLCLVMGDCVTNLRAALDYVAWQLAGFYGPPRTTREETGIQFPICSTSSGDLQKAKGWSDLQKMTWITTDVMGIIERAQPYHAGQESLTALDILVKIDKHRFPLLTGGVADTSQVFAAWLGNDVDIDIALLDATTPSIMPHLAARPDYFKAEMARPVIYQCDDVDVHAQVHAFVAFSDASMPRGPVELALEDIVKAVADIIQRFDGFW